MQAIKIQTSLDDRYEALEDADYHLKEAMKAISGINEYADWFQVLDDLHYEVKGEFEAVEAELAREDEINEAMMKRMYERDAM